MGDTTRRLRSRCPSDFLSLCLFLSSALLSSASCWPRPGLATRGSPRSSCPMNPTSRARVSKSQERMRSAQLVFPPQALGHSGPQPDCPDPVGSGQWTRSLRWQGAVSSEGARVGGPRDSHLCGLPPPPNAQPLSPREAKPTWLGIWRGEADGSLYLKSTSSQPHMAGLIKTGLEPAGAWSGLAPTGPAGGGH